ncbi:MAG: hypothetical protein Q7S66_01370 [bacterium]|nr:hypothetical protein [bacterium]
MDHELPYNLDIASAEQKESIKAIEALRFGSMQKAELILVLLGVKQATDVVLYSWNDTPQKTEDWFTQARLCATKLQIDQNNIEGLSAKYAVARDQPTADRLALLDPSRDHAEFGRMMSYPQTAIDAFGGLTKLDRDDYPDMNGIIFNCALSKDHYTEELRLLRYWSELIKKYSPAIYSELDRAGV